MSKRDRDPDDYGDSHLSKRSNVVRSNTIYATPPDNPMEFDISYAENLENACSDYKFAASYILTDIGNKLLLTASTRYEEIGDPLDFIIKKLQNDLSLYGAAKLGLITPEHLNIIRKLVVTEGLDDNAREALQGVVQVQEKLTNILEVQGIENKLVVINEELIHVKGLSGTRQELNKMLQAAFPFAERRLSQTFIKKYQDGIRNISEDQIIEDLRIFYTQISSQQGLTTSFYLPNNPEITSEKMLEFFDVEVNMQKRKGSTHKYLKKTTDDLAKEIEKIIGRDPTDSEVLRYCKVHDVDTNIQEITNTVRGYIAEHSDEIRNTMQGIAKYMQHPDYLASLRSEDFLVQILAYRQLSRDLQKTVLVEGNAEQRNIPPGINSTIKITTGGSATLFLGELGSYKNIGKNNTETLRHYKDFYCYDAEPIEKEDVFKSLHQIEAIRSSSALVTHAMFFELAAENFEPKRLCPGNNWHYDFNKIATQMPMAMKGAVGGAIFLNSAFEDKLTSNLPYDYRLEGDKGDADILHSKNSNILFDFLLWKSGISVEIDRVEVLLNYGDAEHYQKEEEKITYHLCSIILNEYNFICEILPPHGAFEVFLLPTKTDEKVPTQKDMKTINTELKKFKKVLEDNEDNTENLPLHYSLKMYDTYYKDVLNNFKGKFFQITEFSKKIKILQLSKSVYDKYISEGACQTHKKFELEGVHLTIDSSGLEHTDFIFTAVNSYPLDIFNELFSTWYKTDILRDDLQGTLSVPVEVIGDYFEYVDFSSEDS